MSKIKPCHDGKETSQVPCCKCGGEVVEFSIPNDIWNFVMRTNGKESNKEYLCFNCWHETLRRKFIEGEHEKTLLQERLAESQRREIAAINDLVTIHKHGLCEVCGREPQCLMSLNHGNGAEEGTVCDGEKFEWCNPVDDKDNPEKPKG